MFSQPVIAALVFLFVIVLPITLINRRLARAERDGDWYHHGLQMRRWRDGQWEYRDKTAEEYEQHQCDTAW